MTTDPVCGMDVDPTAAAGKTVYRGRTYYFCSASCKQEFDDSPEEFARERRGKPRKGVNSNWSDAESSEERIR